MSTSRKQMAMGLAALVLASLAGAPTAQAGPGSQLWATLHTKVAYHAVTSDGHRMYVAGRRINPVSGDFDFLVDAIDPATGSLIWRNAQDDGTDETSGWWKAMELGDIDVVANNVIATSGGRVFAVGASCTSWHCHVLLDQLGFSDSETTIVRAYDASTGVLLWSHLVADAGPSEAVAATSSRVFVGTTKGMRAYDAKTGDLLWERPHDFTPVPQFGVATINQIITVRNYVFASFGNNMDGFRVRAYHAQTGSVLWDDAVHLDAFTAGAQSLAFSGGRLFVGGYTDLVQNNLIEHHWVVRAYNASTGALLWQDPASDDGAQHGQVFGVTAASGRVFAVGLAGDYGVYHWQVRTLDQKTGGPVWQDQPNIGENSRATAVTFASGRSTALNPATGAPMHIRGLVFVVGRSAPPLSSFDEARIRAYDPATGALVWSTAVGINGSDADWVSVNAASNHLFVAGTSSTFATGTQDGLVGAYQPF